MSSGWIERRYGFGAGRVPLLPTQRRLRDVKSLRESWAEAHRAGDPPGNSVAQIAKASPAFVAVALVLAWVFAAVLTPPPDESEITIVAFAEPPVIEEPLPVPIPEELPPPPPPLPELVPEPVPVPVAKPELPPPPKPERVEPPPPVAPPPPRPAKPPPPMPQIQQVARAPEPPRPRDAPRRVTRDPRALPQAAPRLSLDPLATPELAEAPPPKPSRAPRFAAARPPDAMPRLDAPALRTAPAAAAPLPTRSERKSAPTPDRRRPATPQLARTNTPALPSEPTPPQRNSRRAPALPAPRRSRRAEVDLAVPDSGPARKPAPRPSASRPRAERPAPVPAARPRSEEPGVQGVPLGSLAACISDRVEDALKQKVVAAVRDRTHCESPAGRYHFVETKNVNAFLMRIERAKQRGSADRCAELTFALDCLSGRKR